jgi:hypothetical protein
VSRPVFGVDNCRSERLRSSPAVQCQMVLDRVELDVPDLPDCHDVGDPGRPPPVALRATQDARPEHVLFWQKVDRRAGDLPVRRIIGDRSRHPPVPGSGACAPRQHGFKRKGRVSRYSFGGGSSDRR